MPIFNKLKVLGNLADNMVEGKFNSEIIDFKEGEQTSKLREIQQLLMV